MATDTSDGLSTAVPRTGLGVADVLATPRVAPPPATLEEARSQPGPAERIEELARRIESEGIKYVFFQQVSITGRVMGKGVVASFFPQVAERGYQLVYGATANLFTDRAGNYIGFGPEESELAAVADLDTFAVLPWDPRVARVFCDCYDTETGELLDADPRQNLKRVAHEFETELGLPVPDRHRARDDVAQAARGRRGARGRHQALLLPHPPVRGASSGADGRRRVRAGARPRHELRRPRGRARASSSSTSASTAPSRTADNITTYRQVCAAVARKHGLLATFMPKPFTGVSANGHHHHFTLMDDEGTNVFHDPDGPAQLSETARHFLGGLLEHFAALMCIGNPTVNSYCRMWDTGFWAPIYKNWGWQNRTTTVRVASGGRFEYRGVDSSCNPYLTVAALLSAGLDGMRRELDPGEPQQGNTYDLLQEGPRSRACPTASAPRSMRSAADDVVRGRCPAGLYKVFDHYKRDEWERYLAAVTDWEREEYLEVLP